MRLILNIALLTLWACGPALCLAQIYPVKPVRFIIPFPPGGPTDIMGRLAAETLSRAWGVQVVADNRPGAGGNMPRVPYKGAGPAMIDQISGQIEVAFSTAIAALPFVQQGKWAKVAKAAKVRAD